VSVLATKARVKRLRGLPPQPTIDWADRPTWTERAADSTVVEGSTADPGPYDSQTADPEPISEAAEWGIETPAAPQGARDGADVNLATAMDANEAAGSSEGLAAANVKSAPVLATPRPRLEPCALGPNTVEGVPQSRLDGAEPPCTRPTTDAAGWNGEEQVVSTRLVGLATVANRARPIGSPSTAHSDSDSEWEGTWPTQRLGRNPPGSAPIQELPVADQAPVVAVHDRESVREQTAGGPAEGEVGAVTFGPDR
jgi:hypothetical protein